VKTSNPIDLDTGHLFVTTDVDGRKVLLISVCKLTREIIQVFF